MERTSNVQGARGEVPVSCPPGVEEAETLIFERSKKGTYPWFGLGLGLLYLWIGSSVYGGQMDSLAVQATRERHRKSPTGALWRSALVPGWGQWYTEHRRKSVLVAGAELFFAGASVYEDVQVSRSSTLLEANQHRTQRTTFLFWLAGTWVYSLVDAYVDAHLFRFDEDLEEKVTYRRFGRTGDTGQAALGLCIRF